MLAEKTLGKDITLPLASSQDIANGTITSHDLLIVYHYCEFSDPRTLQPTVILGTLIRQLLETVTIPEDLGQQIEQCYTPSTRQAMPEELFAVLKNALKRFSKAYVLIDGLDECKREDICLVLSMLEELLQSQPNPPPPKVLIFSRDLDMIPRIVTSYARLEVSINKMSFDINSYIEETVKSKISCGDLNISDVSLEKEVIATLKEGAHGM